ncbi:MAG: HD domain-containing protein [Candidatus Polarisedimenticolia bacterium]
MSDNVALLLQAARFSAVKHRHQRRKGKAASPYINHPLEVADLVANVGGITDVKVLVAALLHDTVEDTGTTPTSISSNGSTKLCGAA